MAWFKRAAHPEDQLSAYVDGELDEAARRSIGAHLADCEACSSLLAELQATKSLLAELPQLQPSRSFALGYEHARQRQQPRQSAFRLAPVAALTVFLALLVVDLGSFGATSQDDAGLSTAASQSGDKATGPEAFRAGGASDSAGAPNPAAASAESSAPTQPPVAAADTDESAGEQRQTLEGEREEGKASSDGPSLLRILEAGAAVAFGASLLVLVWPRIRGRGER